MLCLESLADIAARAGDVRLSRYLTAMPETAGYLTELAGRYTAGRELITARKMSIFIFGSDSHAYFPNCDEAFREMFRKPLRLSLRRNIANSRQKTGRSLMCTVMYGCCMRNMG